MHRYLESSKLAFADRNAYLGDPDFVDVPLRCLLSESFADVRGSLISETARPTPSLRDLPDEARRRPPMTDSRRRT